MGEEKSTQLAPGGVESCLLRLGQVVDQRSPTACNVVHKQLSRRLGAESRLVIEPPDDLAADEPEVVEVASKPSRRQLLPLQVPYEGTQHSCEVATDWFILVVPRPTLWPLASIVRMDGLFAGSWFT